MAGDVFDQGNTDPNKIKIPVWKDRTTSGTDMDEGYRPLPFKALMNANCQLMGKTVKIAIFPNKNKTEAGTRPDADMIIEILD